MSIWNTTEVCTFTAVSVLTGGHLLAHTCCNVAAVMAVHAAWVLSWSAAMLRSQLLYTTDFKWLHRKNSVRFGEYYHQQMSCTGQMRLITWLLILTIKLTPELCCVAVGIHGVATMGPVFLDSRLTGDFHLLETRLGPYLDAVALTSHLQFYFQRDGTLPHFSWTVCQWLD
jgi:hypothetical protein